MEKLLLFMSKRITLYARRDQQVSYLIHGRLREGGLINLIVSKSVRPYHPYKRMLVSVNKAEQLKFYFCT